MDIWRPGFVRASFAEIIEAGSLEKFEIGWLVQEEPRFTFLADPFGVVRGNRVYVFTERLEYRDRHGRLEVLTFDHSMRFLDREICVSEPWHLSFPVLFHDQGEDYLLPEAHRSGGLYLYRAAAFPTRWERIAKIELPHVPIDPSPVFHDGLWWLFHGRAGDPRNELHLAYSESLAGPWRMHPANPLVSGPQGSRPAGGAVIVHGQLVLPVQDCSRTYGGGVRPLWIERLDPRSFAGRHGTLIEPRTSMSPYVDGLHTLSACGPITLFDAKRIDRSIRGKWVGLRGKAARAASQFSLLRHGIPPR